MSQEDKELLLKDLCARLPYKPKCFIYTIRADGKKEDWVPREVTTALINLFVANDDYVIVPYFRPMSSMTEEERQEFSTFIGKTEVYVQQICLDADSMANPIIGGNKCVYWGLFDKCIDWLNKNMFDYRGLIEKGLAIKAPD